MALPSSHMFLKKTIRPKGKKNLQKGSLKRTYSMPRVQWAGRSLSATAGGTQGWLDLEHDPLMHIIEERRKENPNYNGASPSPQNMVKSTSH